MKGNHYGHCIIMPSPVKPFSASLVHDQLPPEPRGVKPTGEPDWPPAGRNLRNRWWGPIKHHLCYNPTSCWKSLYEGFLPRCRQLISTLPLLLFLHQHQCVERKRAQCAVQPQCGGGETCLGRRMPHWSRLRGNAEEISPRFGMCFYPPESRVIKHVKCNMRSGVGGGGCIVCRRHQHPAEWRHAHLSVYAHPLKNIPTQHVHMETDNCETRGGKTKSHKR